MSAWIIIYAVIGLCFVATENDNLNVNFEGMPRGAVALTILEQVVHYFRLCITWPLCLIESVLVTIDDMVYPIDDDEDEKGEE